MSFAAMTSPKTFDYDKVVETVVGAVNTTEDGPEAEAKRVLLNHLLLERYGMDVNSGRMGLRSSRGKLAELYLLQMKGKSEQEKAKEAVQKVDALILAFNKALDTIRFPNKGKEALKR